MSQLLSFLHIKNDNNGWEKPELKRTQMWPGLGKSSIKVQELESLLLTNFVATLVHYPDTTTE